jgi:hypothetical protein
MILFDARLADNRIEPTAPHWTDRHKLDGPDSPNLRRQRQRWKFDGLLAWVSIFRQFYPDIST